MSEHTPGPWAVGPDLEVVYEPNGCRVTYPLSITSMKGRTDEDRANARLIAAAPEMLESLKDLLTVMEHCDEGQYQSYLGSGVIFDTARDIVDDLKGETA